MNDPTICQCYCHLCKTSHPLKCCTKCERCSQNVRLTYMSDHEIICIEEQERLKNGR